VRVRCLSANSASKHRVFDEVIKFLAIAFYLWVMFGVFALHESVVSAKNHIDYHFYGFAVINALILGKVMLVAEDLHFADWFKDRPLIYPILCKAVAFSILFLVFDVLEEVLVGVFKGKTIGESIPTIGGGTPSGVFFVAVILAVALIPFFAFRAVGRAIGERELHSLMFTGGAKSGCISLGNRPRGPLTHTHTAVRHVRPLS
jgi:fumarate reductase subunit C